MLKISDGVKLNGNLFEGYLVRFSDGTRRDLDGEYFTKNTFFGYADTLPVYYHHGFDKDVKTTRIGMGQLQRTDEGIYLVGEFGQEWYNEQVKKAQSYLSLIKSLGLKGFLGFSSGAPSHIVERTPEGEITQWVLAEASLTPTPADWRNRAEVKAIFDEHGIKAGATYSSATKERIRTIRNNLIEGMKEIDAIVAEFDTVEQPAEVQTIIEPTKTVEKSFSPKDLLTAYINQTKGIPQ